MAKIDNYIISDVIKKNDSRSIYRVKDQTGKSYIMKLLHHIGYSHAEGVKLRREAQISKRVQSTNILNVLSSGLHEGSPYNLYEDFSGVSLKEWLKRTSMDLNLFYETALLMVNAVMACHAAGIVHRDVNPSNFIVSNDLSVVKLSDFGIAEFQVKLLEAQEQQNSFQGTVEYISPEQSGKIVAPMDFRADIYSLGISFFEMLTGMLPFTSSNGDVYEVINLHLSQQVPSVMRINPLVPKTLSDLVSKMVEKHPEERYQSVFGIKEDLVRLKVMAERDYYQFFEVGQRDASPIFKPAKGLYSRQGVFDEIVPSQRFSRTEKSRFSLLKGERGIGKTFILDEVRKRYYESGAIVFSIKGQKGNYAKPYAALEKAIVSWIAQLKHYDPVDYDATISYVEARLGPNIGLLLKVFPSLRDVLSGEELDLIGSPKEHQMRFHQAMVDFFFAIKGDASQLLIDVDDLHHVDDATARVLVYLAGTHLEGVDFICAMDQVGLSENCRTFVDTVPFVQYELVGFNYEDTSHFIRSCFQTDLATSQALTEVLMALTHGSPGALRRILEQGVVDEVIHFDYLLGRWHFDASKQRELGLSANVLAKHLERVDSLDGPVRSLLEYATLLPKRFALNRLLHLVQSQEFEWIDCIADLVEGQILQSSHRLFDLMLNPIDNQVLESVKLWYANEALREAIYERIAQGRLMQMHLELGLKLYALENAMDRNGPHYEELRYHLNSVNPSLLSDSVRMDLAKMNYWSAQHAKSSAAFDSALREVQRAKALIVDFDEAKGSEFKFEIFLLEAEMMYLNRDFMGSQKAFEMLLKNAQAQQDKVRINRLRLQMYIHQGEVQSVVALALETLDLLDYPLSDNLGMGKVALQLFRLQLSPLLNEPSRIVKMKVSEDQRAIMILEILNLLISVSYLLSKVLFIRIILSMLELSHKYGMLRLSPFAFATYGIVEVGLFKRYYRGFSIAEASLQAAMRHGDLETLSKVNFTLGFFLTHWVKHIREGIPYLEDGREQSKSSGNMVYFAYNSAALMLARVASSDNLLEIYEAATKDLSHPDILTERDVTNLLIAVREYAKFHLVLKDAEAFDMHQFEKELRSSNMPSILAHHLILKIKYHYMLGDYHLVLALSEEVKPLLGELMGLYISVEVSYYVALSLLKSGLVHQELNRFKRELKKLKAINPQNYAHKYEHVVAVEKWMDGQTVLAHTAFHQAIRSAHEGAFLLEEGLVCEDLASFYSSAGQNRLSGVFIRESYVLFRQIQSAIKCQRMREVYPEVAFSQLEKVFFSPQTTHTVVTGKDSTYDLMFVDKILDQLSPRTEGDPLYQHTIKLGLEITGAQKGVLLIQDTNLVVRAQIAHGEYWKIEPEESLQLTKRVPVQLIQVASRTKEPLVIGNASETSIYAKDQYVKLHRIKSVLCFPLWLNNTFIGILYLENNLIRDAFAHVRVDLLNLVGRQFALSREHLSLKRDLDKVNKDLGDYKENLGEIVRERTYELSKTRQEIEILLNAVGQGFFSINETGGINPQYSRACVEIFGHDISNESFVKLLQNRLADFDADLAADVISKVFQTEDEIRSSIYLTLLPDRLQLGDRFVTFDYQFVVKSHIKQIAVTMTDITEKVALEREFKQERQVVKMVLNAVRYTSNVRQSIESLEAFIVTEALKRPTEDLIEDHFKSLYRRVHTFKGDFAQWSMFSTTDKLHRLETELAQIYKATQADKLLLADKVYACFAAYKPLEIVSEDLINLEKFLGEQFLEGEPGILLHKSDLQALQKNLFEVMPPKYHSDIAQLLQELTWISFEQVIQQYSHYTQELAESLGKRVAPIQVIGPTVKLDENTFNTFLKSLIHLFRNAIHYGIECIEDREYMGKPLEGQICVKTALVEDKLQIIIEDDGQGLQMPHILEKALTLYPEVLQWPIARQMQCIFDFGVTSNSEVDSVSGRGVGLNAVRDCVHHLGGTIFVDSVMGAYTRFTIEIPRLSWLKV